MSLSSPAQSTADRQGWVSASHRDVIATTNSRFKKAASRAGTQIMQKTGQVERTVDHDFAEQEGKYRT